MKLEFFAVAWELEQFRLYMYGKPIKVLTDHPNGGRGSGVRNRPRPIGIRSTGNDLSDERGRQKGPIYKDGSCSPGQRSRAK